MKTYVLLGLLVVGALVAPAATAHVVILADTDLDGDCDKTEIPSDGTGPHPTVWTSDCGPGGHHGPILP